MRERRQLFPNDNANTEINISPLIDVVFILLIFFIVTTVFVEETGVEVNRPQAASATQLEKNAILIAITEDGQVVYGGQSIGVGGVRGTVRRLMAWEEDMPIIIQVDKSVFVELYTRVHDEARLGGAKSINMATLK